MTTSPSTPVAVGTPGVVLIARRDPDAALVAEEDARALSPEALARREDARQALREATGGIIDRDPTPPAAGGVPTKKARKRRSDEARVIAAWRAPRDAAGPVTALATVADGHAPLTLHGKSFAAGTLTPVVERERVALRLLRYAGPREWRHLVLRPAPAGEPVALALLRYGAPLKLPGGGAELRPGLPAFVTAAEAEMLFPWTRPRSGAPSGWQFVELFPLPAAA